jgi:hypothetical protein
VLAGTAGLGFLAKQTFDYNQELEGTQIAIAGLLYANNKYTDSLGNVVDSQTAFQAANAESTALISELQRESLKTAATVPQIADAFAVVYGALNQAGVKAENSAIVQLTTRLTQAANAMKVPMEQIRQEITSLLTGQITQDSTVAKRLGLDNAAIKQMQANGTLVAEIMRRAEGYALAAEAQSNTVRGKLVNTIEVVIATLSRAFDPLIQKSKGALDAVFEFFATNGERIATFAQRVVAGVESVVGAIAKWIRENRGLVDEILAFGAVAAAAVAAYGLIAAAIAAITSPIALVIGGIVGLALIWEKTRKYSEIEIGGRPIAAYVRATFETVTSIWTTNIRTQLGVMKAMFDTVVAGVTTTAAAMRLIGTVVQLPMRVLRALADAAGETAHKVGKAFAPLAAIIAAPVSRVVQLVSALGASFRSLIGAAEVPARRVGEVFGKLVDFVTAPLRQLLGLLAQLPAKLVEIVPGADAVRDAARDFLATLPQLAKPAETLGTTLRKVSSDARESAAEIRAALATKEGFGSVADTVRGAWGDAAKWLSAQLPELTTLGKKAGAALGLTAISTVAPLVDAQAAERAHKALQKLENEKQAYFRFVADYRAEASAAGDPLSQALAKIGVDRALALSKLEEQKKKLKDAIKADVFEADEGAIKKVFDARAREAGRKASEGLRNDILATLRLQRDLTVAAQRETEDRRIALIKDAGQRELAERLEVNKRWFEDESERVKASTQNEIERANQIDLLAEERKRRDRRDRDDADRAMREATFGYAEYWTKLGATIAAQWRSIGQVISDTVLESRQLLASTVNGFLDDLTSGQTDLLKSLTGLSKGLSSLWTKALTDILMSGKNVASQLQQLFASIHVKNGDGTTDYTGTALAGAGFGGMVGGLFAGPNNYAAEGGTIGGGVGAAIGAAIAGYFTGGLGAGAGAQIGAVIGTVIGTAIGSFITKGTDEINVSIKDGIATVTEKGISAKARKEVETQVQRRVKEETKQWESLLDLFPKAIRNHINSVKSTRKIDLEGGVENADLTDDGALGALADFLGNKLPEAAFEAYSGSIAIGLKMLGANTQRISQLFKYWGTLQGKELHEAVERYIRAVLDAADLRDKISAPFEDKLKAAREYGRTQPLARLDDISAAIDAAVERMAGLTDVEDIIAAQEEINVLSRQYYETQLQYLARIQQIQESITNSIAQQREQIELTGKDDQGKVDFFFERMVELRGQLANTTDPEKISRLVQQIQQYVSMALGIAPDSPEMRAKLLAILGDIEGLAQTQIGKANQEVADRDAKPASALERAAELLLKAAQNLADTTDPPHTPGEGDRPVGDPPGRGGEDGARLMAGPSNESRIAESTMLQFVDRLASLEAPREATSRPSDTRAEELILAIRTAQQPSSPPLSPEDLARAFRAAMNGIELTTLDTIVVDNGDLGERLAEYTERRVIARIKDDPYSILPRAA